MAVHDFFIYQTYTDFGLSHFQARHRYCGQRAVKEDVLVRKGTPLNSNSTQYTTASGTAGISGTHMLQHQHH